MGLPEHAEAQKNLAAGETQRKRSSSWKSFQSSLKRYLQKASPLSFLSKLMDCYVDSVTVAANHINDSSLVHGPYIGSLQHSASRELHREEDDLFHVARTLSKRDASLPRSPSYAGPTAIQVDGSNWGRSRSHASVYIRPSDNNTNSSRHVPNSYTYKTALSVTHEE